MNNRSRPVLFYTNIGRQPNTENKPSGGELYSHIQVRR